MTAASKAVELGKRVLDKVEYYADPQPATKLGDEKISQADWDFAKSRGGAMAVAGGGGLYGYANLEEDAFNEIERSENAELMQSLNTLNPMDFADTDTVIDDNGEEATYGIIGRDTDDEVAIRLNNVEPAPEGEGDGSSWFDRNEQRRREWADDYIAKNRENAALAFEESDAYPEEDESFVKQFGAGMADLEVGLNALPSDIAIGFAKLAGNAWGAFFPQHQASIDEFFKPVDEFRNQTMKDHPVADVAGSVAQIGAQLVFPAIAGRNLLIKAGMPMVRATVVAEVLTGFLAFSPKDATLINDLIDADEDDKTLKTIRDWLATDPGNENAYAARSKQAFEALVVLGLGEGVIRGLISGIGKANAFLKTGPGKAVLAMATAAGVLAPDDAEAGAGSKILRVLGLTRKEGGFINKAVNRGTKLNAEARAEAIRIKNKYHPDEGWEEVSVAGITLSKDGTFKSIKFKQPAYNFHKPPAGVSSANWETQLSEQLVDDVGTIVARAQNGDKAAIAIIEEAKWYRAMRDRLRKEFGGMGDVFADLLGSTSAQTGVKENWKNSVEVLRRFSRGDYDAEIAAYAKRVEQGQSMSGATLHQLEKAGEFPLIRSAAGALFNANSPAATGALLDLFRQIKVGKSPKTINFTGNLIGYTNDATIDVWAARYLREAAGLPRIAPPAEKAVGGKHLTHSTLGEPRIGGEFAFGQKIFARAAERINSSGLVKNYRSDLGDLGADDLQAVAWFMQKEKWAKGRHADGSRWTSKAGEGGSLDVEASKADLQRTTLGVSRERPDLVPSNYEQAELAAEFDDVVRADTNVVGYKLTNTHGRFMNADERALDAEFVTNRNFDPAPLTRRLVEMGKKHDQDSVFISKVVEKTHENARPGIEIYFGSRVDMDVVNRVTELLNANNIDGFTFVTDMRQGDRINVQAMAGGGDTAGITGIRMQYIPEYDDTFDAARRVEKMAEIRIKYMEVLETVMEQFDDISNASVVDYDTKIFFKDDYDEYLRGRREVRGNEVGQGQQNSPDAPQQPGGRRPDGT